MSELKKPPVYMTLPFGKSGFDDNSDLFREILACCYYNFLPNGRPITPRMCLLGMKTGLVLPYKLPYEVYGVYPDVKIQSASKGIYMVEFAGPCALLPVGALTGAKLPLCPDVILYADDEVFRSAIEKTVEIRNEGAKKADLNDLILFVREQKSKKDPERIAYRIEHFLQNGYFLPPDSFLAWNSLSSFLFSLPRPVFHAICLAITHHRREVLSRL